jgi:hypothetical protein
MTKERVILGMGTLLLAALAACGGTTVSGPGQPPGDPVDPGGPSSPPMCGAIELIPPAITVKTESGSSTCDPTFTLVGADASPSTLSVTRCPSDVAGCPTGTTKESCTFVLFGFAGGSIDSGGTYTVAVSEPGYETTVVKDVFSGTGGCVDQPTPASYSQVTLWPGIDAGTPDAG